MRSILFVCTANICRSPTAEGVLRRMVGRDGLEREVRIESAGTHDYYAGTSPFPAAIEAAKERGYDISTCVSRLFVASDFDRFDMILAMDRANLRHLRAFAPTRCRDKVELLLDYGTKYHGKEVPDPFKGSKADFELALAMIEDGCEGVAGLLKHSIRR
jgi:protein-tyrosine phosphatase